MGYQTVLYLAVISGISLIIMKQLSLMSTKLQQARYITIPHLDTSLEFH